MVDWNRAKNLIIIMLFILNICLGLLNFSALDAKYYITKKQVSNITKVLDEVYNCKIEDEMIIRQFKPKKRIVMESFNFNEQQLKEAFFGDDASTEYTEQGFGIKDNDGVMIVYDNTFQYLSSREPIEGEFDRKEAEKICEKTLNKLGNEFKNFKLDKIFKLSDSQIIIYYKDIFRNYVIESSSVRFVFDSEGIISFDGKYLKKVGFENKKIAENIIPTDELLLYFVKDLRAKNYEGTIEISEIKFVYSEEEEKNDTDKLYLVPFYRIYLKDSHEPILVLADYYDFKIL